jgi:hypothetical protein
MGKIKDLNYPTASPSIARINSGLHKTTGEIGITNKFQLKNTLRAPAFNASGPCVVFVYRSTKLVFSYI